MTIRRPTLPAIALLALQSCAVIEDPTFGNAPPARYRQIVADYLRLSRPDLAGIRDASISEPKADQVWTEREAGQPSRSGSPSTPVIRETIAVPQAGWAVCWRGAIVKDGAQQVANDMLLIRGENVVASAMDSPRNDVGRLCAGAIYAPFPELR